MCLFLFDFFDVCCTFYFSISLLSCPHLCAVVNAHGKVGSFQLSKRERQQKQQTTVFNTTNNTTNNSKPTATTIVTAQRKDKSNQVNLNSGRFGESVAPLPGPKPEAQSHQKQTPKATKTGKTHKNNRKIPPQRSFSTMLQAYLGSHNTKRPQEKTSILMGDSDTYTAAWLSQL